MEKERERVKGWEVGEREKERERVRGWEVGEREKGEGES